MAEKSDLIDTLDSIRNFWPDFNITKEDILAPTSDFVFRFYSNFIAEFNEKICYLSNEEFINEEFDEAPEFDVKIRLYCKVARIYRKMKCNFSLSLYDFYNPYQKKIHLLLKLAIHLLSYINYALDEIYNIVNNIFNQITECERLEVLQKQLTQDCADEGENLGRVEYVCETLKEKLKVIKEKHETMLKEKSSKENLYCEKNKELSHLTMECDNLDYELQLLEQKERNLQEKIVTQEDFDSLKNTEEMLKMEQEELSNDDIDFDVEVNSKINMVKSLEQYAKDLEMLDFASLDVETLSTLKEEIKTHQNNNKKLKEQHSSLNDIKMQKIQNTQKLNETKEQGKKHFSDIQSKIIADTEEAKNNYNDKITQYTEKFQEFQKLQAKIIGEEEEINKIENEKCILNEFVSKKYKSILDANRNTTNKFNDMLLAIDISKLLSL